MTKQEVLALIEECNTTLQITEGGDDNLAKVEH